MRIMGVMMLASTVAMVDRACSSGIRRGTQGQMADSAPRLPQVPGADAAHGAQDRAHASATRSSICTPPPTSCGRWSPRAAGCGNGAPATTTSGRYGSGSGAQQLATPLVAPDTAPVDELEPLTAGAMQRSSRCTAPLDGLPMAVSLRAFYHVTVSGEPEAAAGDGAGAGRPAGHAALPRGPGDRRGRRRRARVRSWDWTKWLPHAQVPAPSDGAGTRRLFGDDLGELEELLAEPAGGPAPLQPATAQPLLDQPHIVVVLDGGIGAAGLAARRRPRACRA